jgi:GTPase KRas
LTRSTKLDNYTPLCVKAMAEYRIVVLGAHRSGKSSLVQRIVLGEFGLAESKAEDEAFRMNTVIDNEAVVLDIVDTASEHELTPAREALLLDGQGFVLVYDIHSVSSFEEAKKLAEHVRTLLFPTTDKRRRSPFFC